MQKAIKLIKSRAFQDLWNIVLFMVLAMVIFSMFFTTSRREYMTNASPEPPFSTYYYMEGCPHCVSFTPIWDKFVAQYKGPVKMSKIERSDDNASELEKYNVKSFPTVIVVDKTNVVSEYNGERTVDALNAYFNKYNTPN